MENFKKKLKKRILFGAIYCCLVPCLVLILHFAVGETPSAGFTAGFATGLAGVALFFVIQSALALRNEEKVRRLYIAETDERQLYIANKAASTSILAILAGIGLAAVVASYCDRTVFYTLLGMLFFICASIGASKLYYSKKL
ncbi:MAG: DUF2178 domain-containing protein [Anaerotignum sp.]|nr:DUF2178 domain-containing protein [Anaerotignum sp.]